MSVIQKERLNVIMPATSSRKIKRFVKRHTAGVLTLQFISGAPYPAQEKT